MQAFHQHTGVVAPLPRPDIDTDQIIPKQFLKRLGRTGYDDALFYDWRTSGAPFVLNDPRYAGASILVGGPNFGFRRPDALSSTPRMHRRHRGPESEPRARGRG